MAIDHSKLKKRRLDLGLTQQEMADAAGIPVRTYRSYEQGARDIGTAMLLHLCRTFGLSADELLGIKDSAAYQKVIMINGRYVCMIPIFMLDAENFETDFIDCMPDYFRKIKESKETIAIKINDNSMYPKIENGDILVIRKRKHCRNNDIVLVDIDGVKMIKRAIRLRGTFQLESFDQSCKPIVVPYDKLYDTIIGVVIKLIKNF